MTSARGMPWRKPWVDPAEITDPSELRARLERRAYEVWISEIMLQQTRVAAVIEYWNRWMEKWPTIRDLAAADPDDVLAMWRGLGYYSRATRIHEASRLVCGDDAMDGLLPREAPELMARVPGVGRYTAGAIAAIVFGKAEPMVDGNVLRVLSRQMGVFGDVKTDKTVIDTLWGAADALVKAVAADPPEAGRQDVEEKGQEQKSQVSDRPGRWGQALMELGSTVCTPKPNCAACPISSSCRAYAEGLQFALKKTPTEGISGTPDIEDACTLCKPFEEYAELDDDRDRVTKAQISTKTTTVTTTKTTRSSSSKKQMSLQSFFFSNGSNSSGESSSKKRQSSPVSSEPDATVLEIVANHARKFPVKVVKKAVREEETLVCAVRRKSDGCFLIHRRPEKGLLAGLWEFPSHILPNTNDSTAKVRKGEAKQFMERVVGQEKPLKYVGDLGSVPWLFSHLRLTMHVHLFELDDGDDGGDDTQPNGKTDKKSRWSADVEAESMGTGMRKCWNLVKDSTDNL